MDEMLRIIHRYIDDFRYAGIEISRKNNTI